MPWASKNQPTGKLGMLCDPQRIPQGALMELNSWNVQANHCKQYRPSFQKMVNYCIQTIFTRLEWNIHLRGLLGFYFKHCIPIWSRVFSVFLFDSRTKVHMSGSFQACCSTSLVWGVAQEIHIVVVVHQRSLCYHTLHAARNRTQDMIRTTEKGLLGKLTK